MRPAAPLVLVAGLMTACSTMTTPRPCLRRRVDISLRVCND